MSGRLWFLLALLVSGTPFLLAESFISGRVVDENNAAIPEAAITLRSPDAVWRAFTDPTGAFEFHAPPGDYEVTAERDAYFPLAPRPVHLLDGPQELQLVLNHQRELFQSVKVEGSAPPLDPERTTRQEKLSGLNITGIPYSSTHNLRNAMKLMPGVIQDSRGGLHFSGGAENQVLYTLDGFNIGDPVTGNFSSRLDVDTVRSLEYSTGRFSPEFGKGSAGVLAIQTEMGDDKYRYNATNFVPGIDTRTNLHIGTWAPRISFSGPIVKGRAWFSESTDGEYSTTVVPGLPKDQQRASSVRLGDLLRTQVNLTPGNILFASFLVNTWNAPKTGLGALDPPSTTNNQRTRTWFFSVKDQIYLSHEMLLEVGLGEDRTFARQIPQGDALYQLSPNGRSGNFFVNSMQQSQRTQLVANLFLPAVRRAGRHQWKIGVDFNRLNYEQQVHRTGYEVFGLAGYLLHLTTFAGPTYLRRPGMELSSYLQDAWRIRPNLTVDIGIRQDWDELVRHTAFSPRISFAWVPFASHKTKIAGGYAVTCDPSNLAIFARPLDQYAIDHSFNPDGSIQGEPQQTHFVITNPHLKVPRYANWTLEWDQQLPRGLQAGFNLLRKRGTDGFAYAAIPASPGYFDLTNLRRDTYDSAQVSLHQSFGTQYEWMASYTRSRSLSNSVLDYSVDQPLSTTNNFGPLTWDAPNRFVGWFYLPTPWKQWAVAGLAEARDGFPFSIQRDDNSLVGAVNSHRYPLNFYLDLHLEYRFRFRGMRLALRGGFNNITNHKNYTVVNNTVGSPAFLRFYGSDGRHFVLRFRWLGKE
jgi:hypothetical protein